MSNNKSSVSIELSWIIVLFVILKLTGVIHLSWLWIVLPVAFVLVILLFGMLLGLLGMGIALAALKSGNIKWTIKR